MQTISNLVVYSLKIAAENANGMLGLLMVAQSHGAQYQIAALRIMLERKGLQKHTGDHAQEKALNKNYAIKEIVRVFIRLPFH